MKVTKLTLPTLTAFLWITECQTQSWVRHTYHISVTQRSAAENLVFLSWTWLHDDFSGITHPILIKYHVQILWIFHIEEHFTNYCTYFIILPVALLKIILFYFVVTKIHSAKIWKVLEKIPALLLKNSALNWTSWTW